ncbi:MAG: CHAT domain-containing protein, partial [Bacteroidota bacterium]
FLGKENLYYLITSQSESRFERKEVSEKNLSDLQQFLLNVSSVSQNEAISKNLYKWLGMNQVDRNKDRLIVIPNNILGYLPFETLQNEKGEMLFEKFSISYAPSVRLVHQLSIDKRNNDKSWAGFLTDTNSEVSLDAANNEVAQLSNLLKGDVFKGSEASSISLFEAASTYDIIHLALHSKADANNPLFSKIYFDEEVINAADIYGSTISSKMVVLSSCESGSGQLKKGEGVMSLSRAFTYAGAASTVVSLWEVPDKETARIMTLFYQHLKQGKAKDVALCDAKLEYLNTTEDALLKHPYYWAGFVVTGDTSPLFEKQTYSWWVITGIGVLSLVGFIVYRKKRSVQAA